MSDELDTILVTAYAKAPQNTAMSEVYKYIGLVLEIDRNSRKIVDAEFTVITDLTKKYLKKIFIGYCMDDGVDGLLKKVEKNYFTPSTTSFIVAIKSAFRRYEERVSRK